MRTNSLILAIAAWAATSCGSRQKLPGRHTPSPADVHYDIKVWVESDARMPKAVVFKGCAAWKAMNVTCVETEDQWLADIRVYADEGECTRKDDKTRVVLAWATWNGGIKMMMRCLNHSGNIYDEHQLAAILTHEVGHHLGIWEHVPSPPKCENAMAHPSGRVVCGTAIMNPYYDKDIDYVTDIDALAFDVRDPEHSVLVSDTPDGKLPGCIYLAPIGRP